MDLRDQILEKIIQRAAVAFKKSPSELSADTKFVEDLKAKSVNYVQIITVIMDEFDVEYPFHGVQKKEDPRRSSPVRGRPVRGLERSAKVIPVSTSFRTFKNRSYRTYKTYS